MKMEILQVMKNWMKQTNWKFIKYVIHHKHSMTPEQLKKKPFKEIIKIGHEQLDTEEGESNMMKRNPPHLRKYQKKVQNMIHLLKMKKSQKQQKHFQKTSILV